MKTTHKVIGLSIAVGLAAWLVDTIVDYAFFSRPNQTLSNSFLAHGSPHEVYMRSLAAASLLVFGVLVAAIVARLERTKAELRENEGKLGAMLEAIADHVCMIDGDLNVIWANEIAKRLFGDDIVGRKCYEAYHGREKPCEPQPCLTLQAFQDGRVHCHETQVQDRDGNTMYFHCTANVALRDKAGEPAAVLKVSRDVTAQKKAKSDLLRSERLRADAEKLAATGRMAARIAHEVNNPLAGIKNTFRLVNETVPEQYDCSKWLRRLDGEIDRIAHIIGQMLDLHRPIREHESDVVVADVVEDVVSLLEPAMRKHGVSVEVIASDPPIAARLPQDSFRQVLLNLLINGIEASPPGGSVTLSAERVENTLRIVVSDQGPGISDEDRSKVFEPFFTTKERKPAGGLGLGLSICKSTAEALGGSVDFEYRTGRGATFRFVLPLTQTSEALHHG